MIHCKNCKQKFYVMNENSELEGKVIQCKYCNDQSIYESRTVYLENRLEELSKDLDNAEIKINYKKKEHQDKIDQLHNDLKDKNNELKKQTLLQEKVNVFENRLKETEKLNLEELELVNEVKKIKNKIKELNKSIDEKTNIIPSNFIKQTLVKTEEKNETLNDKEQKSLDEVINRIFAKI